MLNKLEKALGYKFRDPELLRMALTHTSCANEIYQDPLRSYERLEFLGDSIVCSGQDSRFSAVCHRLFCRGISKRQNSQSLHYLQSYGKV